MYSFTCSLSGQKLWTLEECINYAIKNNIQIKQQELTQKISSQYLKQTKLNIVPSINAGIGQNFNFGKNDNIIVDNNISNSTNFQISANLNLFSGLQNYNNIKKTEIDNQMSAMIVEQTKSNISLTVTSAYLNVIFAKDLLELAKNQKKITELQLERTEKMITTGNLSLQAKYELEAQLANEELVVVNYENQILSQLLQLSQLLEIADFQNFNIVKPDINKSVNIEQNKLSEIYDIAVEQRPEIKYAKLNTKSHLINTYISKSSYYPKLSMSFAYGTGYSNSTKIITNTNISKPILNGFAIDNAGNILDVYNFVYDYTYATKPFKDQLKSNANPSLSLNLNIPIFNGLQAQTSTKIANLQYEQAKLNEEQARKDLFKTIQQAYLDWQSSIKQVQVSEKALSAVQINFNYAQVKYESGLLNTTEYNIAKNNLLKSEIELLKSKYDCVFKQKILDFYKGITISLE